jgi:polyribonucleotide nucleotidyltransferase
MESEMPAPRSDLNGSAPRIQQLQIDPEKIGAFIGPEGKSIKRITEVSNAQINILEDNSGRIHVYANSKASMDRAIMEINLAIGDIEIGKTYRGIVRGIKEFGVFVECLPGKEGLVHISELADYRVEKAEDVCKMGDELIVRCIGVDEKGRVKLSRKAALCDAQGIEYTPPPPPPRAENRYDKHHHRR